MNINTLIVIAIVIATVYGIGALAYWYFEKHIWPIQRRKPRPSNSRSSHRGRQAPRASVHEAPESPGVP